MRNKKAVAKELSVRPRLRVLRGNEIALGPGRIDLLEYIGETGTLRGAAKRMGISYMRAWNLVRYTNRCFAAPVVQSVRGGKAGGGARLTSAGNEVVVLYRRMERESQKAVSNTWAGLKKLLKS